MPILHTVLWSASTQCLEFNLEFELSFGYYVMSQIDLKNVMSLLLTLLYSVHRRVGRGNMKIQHQELNSSVPVKVPPLVFSKQFSHVCLLTKLHLYFSWKDRACPFRTDSRTKLMVIPTLIKWKGVQRLEGSQCGQQDLLQMLFEEDDQLFIPRFLFHRDF